MARPDDKGEKDEKPEEPERYVYRVLGDRTLTFPTLSVTAKPGETFETDHELVEDGNFERIQSKKSAGAAGKED